MILVTVGTQLPFDRLVGVMDRIAPQLGEPVVAQTGPGTYVPQHMRWQAGFEPVEFERLLAEARVIVAHAGIGSVLSAQRHGKPIVLFARRAAFGEHRNDHQLATVAQLEGRRGIYVANNEAELLAMLRATDLDAMAAGGPGDGRKRLTQAISAFLAHRLPAPRKLEPST